MIVWYHKTSRLNSDFARIFMQSMYLQINASGWLNFFSETVPEGIRTCSTNKTVPEGIRTCSTNDKQDSSWRNQNLQYKRQKRQFLKESEPAVQTTNKTVPEGIRTCSTNETVHEGIRTCSTNDKQDSSWRNQNLQYKWDSSWRNQNLQYRQESSWRNQNLIMFVDSSWRNQNLQYKQDSSWRNQNLQYKRQTRHFLKESEPAGQTRQFLKASDPAIQTLWQEKDQWLIVTAVHHVLVIYLHSMTPRRNRLSAKSKAQSTAYSTKHRLSTSEKHVSWLNYLDLLSIFFHVE